MLEAAPDTILWSNSASIRDRLVTSDGSLDAAQSPNAITEYRQRHKLSTVRVAYILANLSIFLELKPELLQTFERASVESKEGRGLDWKRSHSSLVEVPLSDQQGICCVRSPVHDPAEATCLQFSGRGLYAGFCPGDQKHFADKKMFSLAEAPAVTNQFITRKRIDQQPVSCFTCFP